MKRWIWGVGLLIFVLSGCRGELRKFEVTTSNIYPLSTDGIELTYALSEAREHLPEDIASLNELPMKKKLEELTGIKIKYIHPPTGRISNYYHLMFASGNLPDIMEYSWHSRTMGSDAMIKDNIIIALDEYIENVSPNLKRLLENNPDIAEGIKTFEGHYYMYPFIRENEKMTTYRGTIIRQDLLEQCDLPLPETLDEWEVTLRAMKSIGIEKPMLFSIFVPGQTSDPIISAFQLSPELYVENGVVKLGYYEPAFRDYVELLARWYREGLIDVDTYLKEDVQSEIHNLVIESKTAAFRGTIGGQMGSLYSQLKMKTPKAVLVAARDAVQEKGNRPGHGEKSNRITGRGTVITTQCANKEIAARLLDFGYSEAGHMLYNFGIENESYTLVNGYPKYTDNILNPNVERGTTMSQEMCKYLRAIISGPFVQDHRYLEQYYKNDEQKQAYELWNDTDASEYLLPILKMDVEDAEEYLEILESVQKYRNDIIYNIVIGKVKIDYMDTDYYRTMADLGVNRLIALAQKAYERLKPTIR